MKRGKKTSLSRRTKSSLTSLWEFLSDNKKKVMPVILLVCVAITILIAIRANRIAAEQAIADADSREVSHAVSFEASEARLMQDAYPEINALMARYFEAYVSGDVSVLNDGLYRTLDEIETITIEERAKYIEEVANLSVYTKTGPVEDSWVVYAYTDVRYIGCDDFVPAMLSLYVCRDEDGSYYINADESAQSVKDYITTVSLQDDVVDLYNRVNVAYAEKLENDPMMRELVAAIYAEIDESVGERLSGAETALAQAETEATAGEGKTGQGTEKAGEAEAPEAADAASTEPEKPKEIKIRAITNVNVRKSDSTEAEILGKAREGEEYVRIAEQGNGWSKISFAGGAAYVKSDLFEVVDDAPSAPAEEMGATAGASAGAGASTAGSASSAAAQTASPSSASTAGTGSSANGSISGTGTKTVSGNGVRIRKEPSTDSDIVTTLYGGVKVTVKNNRDDGWSEIEYNGSKGYIKTEFLRD